MVDNAVLGHNESRWLFGGRLGNHRFVDVTVQRVQTWWTKASRGGAAAALRNSAPTVFPLPSGFVSGLHDVVMREFNEFAPQARELDLVDPGLGLRVADGLLWIGPPVTSSFSMPRRTSRPPARRIAPGQWIQWLINYRLVGSCGGEWHYRLDAFNVAYGPVAADVFTGNPDRRIDERSWLR